MFVFWLMYNLVRLHWKACQDSIRFQFWKSGYRLVEQWHCGSQDFLVAVRSTFRCFQSVNAQTFLEKMTNLCPLKLTPGINGWRSSYCCIRPFVLLVSSDNTTISTETSFAPMRSPLVHKRTMAGMIAAFIHKFWGKDTRPATSHINHRSSAARAREKNWTNIITEFTVLVF